MRSFVTAAVLVIVAMTFHSQSATAQTSPSTGGKVTFKHTYIGQTQTEFLKSPNTYFCPSKGAMVYGNSLDRETYCELKDQVPEAFVDTDAYIKYWFLDELPPKHDSLLYKIVGRFSVDDYSSVRKAFIEKYGQPTKRETNDLTNALGAHFQVELLLWNIGDAAIILQNYFNDYGTSDSYNLELSSFFITHLPTYRFVAGQMKERSGGKL